MTNHPARPPVGDTTQPTPVGGHFIDGRWHGCDPNYCDLDHGVAPPAQPQPTDDEDRIDDLIERSSFGTPAAKALRESVDEETAQRIVDRANQLRTTQPQPTDDAGTYDYLEELRLSDPSQAPSKSRKLSRKSASSGPDFVGAVARIRELHTEEVYEGNFHGCSSCEAESWPCPTIAALDEAGCL